MPAENTNSARCEFPAAVHYRAHGASLAHSRATRYTAPMALQRITYRGTEGDISLAPDALVEMVYVSGGNGPASLLYEWIQAQANQQARVWAAEERLVHSNPSGTLWHLPGAFGTWKSGVPVIDVSTPLAAITKAYECRKHNGVGSVPADLLHSCIPQWQLRMARIGMDNSPYPSPSSDSTSPGFLASAPLWDESAFRKLARTLRFTPYSALSAHSSLSRDGSTPDTQEHARRLNEADLLTRFLDDAHMLPPLTRPDLTPFAVHRNVMETLVVVDPRLCRFVEVPGVVLLNGAGQVITRHKDRLHAARRANLALADVSTHEDRHLIVAASGHEDTLTSFAAIFGGGMARWLPTKSLRKDAAQQRVVRDNQCRATGVIDPTVLTPEQWRTALTTAH